MNPLSRDGLVSARARISLAVVLWASCLHCAYAQSVFAPGAMRRLPPLTAIEGESHKQFVSLSPLSAPSSSLDTTRVASTPLATSRKTASSGDIQLASAVTGTSAVALPRIRRLPPLTAVAPDMTSKPMRRTMPAAASNFSLREVGPRTAWHVFCLAPSPWGIGRSSWGHRHNRLTTQAV